MADLGYGSVGSGGFLRDLANRVIDPAIPSRWLAFVGDATPYELLVESINPALFSITSKTRFAGGAHRYMVPETSVIQAVTMTIYETHTYDTTAYLEAWRRKVYNPDTEVYGIPNDYMKDVVVLLFPLDSNSPVAKFTLERAWIQDQTPFEYSYANPEGRLMVACNFAINGSKFESSFDGG